MDDTILLEFRTTLAASPDAAFAALTDARALARWFCDEAESEPIAGGRLVMRWHRAERTGRPFAGRWLAIERPRRCAFAGGNADYPDGDAGRVEFALAAEGAGTVLVTRHRLPRRPEYEPIAARYRDAWPRALARLAASLTTGG